ncbi:MAG TPA: hypothetical protein PKZ32_07565 [Candidatus Melainabacteria bacterium]|nr:hypothetical protein [Candidatus Melainabacteria bacterium]
MPRSKTALCEQDCQCVFHSSRMKRKVISELARDNWHSIALSALLLFVHAALIVRVSNLNPLEYVEPAKAYLSQIFRGSGATESRNVGYVKPRGSNVGAVGCEALLDVTDAESTTYGGSTALPD